MLFRRLGPALLSIVLVTCAAALGGCASTNQAAKVNGQVISRGAVEDELADLAKNRAFVQDVLSADGVSFAGADDGTYDARIVAYVINQQVSFTLIRQELARRGRTVSAAEVAAAGPTVEQTYVSGSTGASLFPDFPPAYQAVLKERRADLDALRAAVAGADVSDAGLRKVYSDNPDAYATTCISHILYAAADPNAAQEAADAETRIVAVGDAAAQAQAFAQVAAQDSTDTGSKAAGGALGCQSGAGLDRFVAPFRDAVKALPTGQVSDPVQTQFGFHVILVTSRRPVAFDDVATMIRNSLLQPTDAQFTTLVTQLRRDAHVEVNKRYGRWDTSDADNLQVVPPASPPTTTPTTEAAALAG